MNYKMSFSLLIVLFFVACNNEQDNTASTSLDSNSTAQTNTSIDSSAAAAPANTTSFKGVMDKMMQDMHSVPMTNDPDHDFATMMKHHHQGAIDMSNIELTQGTNAELKQVAQKMITDAQKDITDLNAFISSHQPSGQSDFSKNQMDKMMKSMSMNMQPSGNIDQDFAMMMTMHHQEGIDMAKDYLKVGKAAETKKVANNTIKSNSEDLKKLKSHSGSTAGHDMSQMEEGNTKNNSKSATTKKAAESTDHSQHQ